LRERCKDYLTSFLAIDKDQDSRWEWGEIVFVVKDFYSNIWTKDRPKVVEDDRMEGSNAEALIQVLRHLFRCVCLFRSWLSQYVLCVVFHPSKKLWPRVASIHRRRKVRTKILTRTVNCLRTGTAPCSQAHNACEVVLDRESFIFLCRSGTSFNLNMDPTMPTRKQTKRRGSGASCSLRSQNI